jgi:hypothetical protein
LFDATNGYGEFPADVTPNTLPPDDAPTQNTEPGAGNYALIYLSLVNQGSTAISFATSPALTLNASGTNGAIGLLGGDDSCQLDLFQPPSTWNSVPGAYTPLGIESTSASIPASAQSFVLLPGQTIAAVGVD